jgi:trimeric autotransporter adhesin
MSLRAMAWGACALTLSSFSATAAGDCVPVWQPVHPAFRTTAFSGAVFAMTRYDPDGDGPAPADLVVGGNFLSAGAVDVSYIARWDGQAWHTLGSGVDNIVRALHVFDPDADGPRLPLLFVGGDFLNAGGQPASHVAVWDGATWSQPRGGVSGTVLDFTPFDLDGDGPDLPRLIVGGTFETAGDATVNSIASWDGTAWRDLAGGLSDGGGTFAFSTADALAEFDPDGDGPAPAQLIVTGTFGGAGGVDALNAAGFSAGTWTPLGSGLSVVEPYAVGYAASATRHTQPPHVVVGGFFDTAGGEEAVSVAQWNGSQWGALPGVYGTVVSVRHFDNDASAATPEVLFIGGGLGLINGGNDGLFYRSAGQWRSVQTGLDGDVYVMLPIDPDADGPQPPELLVGGIFNRAGTHAVGNLARLVCIERIPGDVDGDGDVDLVDLATLLTDFGCNAAPCPGDVDSDGDTDLADLAVLLTNFGS